MLVRRVGLFVVGLVLSVQASVAAEIPLPGTLQAFNHCLKTNATPLVANEDLLKVCLKTHAREMGSKTTELGGAYREVEGRIAFILELANMSTDKLMTGVSINLKHPKQKEPQKFVLEPVGILPGTVSLIPLSNLEYVPAKSELAESNALLEVVESYGLTVELQ
jgi:hypothetical protein